MKKDIQKAKIIIIDNKRPIRESIDILYKNPLYKNHLEYWNDYLKSNHFDNISDIDTLYFSSNMIGIKVCLKGKIVFIDVSNDYSDYKNGIIFIPNNVSFSREKLMKLLTHDYNYLDIFYNIEYCDGSIKCEQSSIIREKTKSKQKVYYS